MVITTIDATIATFFRQQLNCLADDRFQVHAVAAPGPMLGTLVRQASTQSVGSISCHAVRMERQPRPMQDLVSLWNLVQLMRQVRPHVVHVHTPKAGLLGMIAARLAGVRVRLYTIHGLPLETRQGWWRKALQSFERTTCHLATKVYCVSGSLEEVVLAMGLCPAAKLSTLGDGSCAGVDIEHFSPDSRERRVELRRSQAIPENARVICFVGRIARDKGIEVLAQAWKQLRDEFTDLHLLVCGPDDASDAVSPEMVRELRAHPRVRMTGDWADAVRDIYTVSDICVLPTFREGLGQVALEAAAMGLPMVASRVTGVVSAVQDGVTGLLVTAGDAAALAHGLRQLIVDEDLRDRMGTSARQVVAARFSSRRVNQLWMNEYRQYVRDFGIPAVSREQMETERS